MSSIDKRIVEMEFDNKSFEAGVNTTIKSVEELKESLNFDSDIQNSIDDVDFSALADGVKAISDRFSTLGIIGATVISNLTTSAMNLISNLSSTFSNLLIQGGMSRAMNIEQAKFQLEGLGVAWKDIVGDIEYGVNDTAYALDAAANVASQLTASGVGIGETVKTVTDATTGATTELDEMSIALRSISGVAAMTNSSYEDIGRVFTTVAGNGRLMGEQLLQIGSRGLNAAAAMATFFNGVNDGSIQASAKVTETVKSITNGIQVSESEIRDFASDGVIDFMTFAEAMDSQYGEHAKEANRTVTGVLDNIQSAVKKIGADFWTPIVENDGPLVECLENFRQLINAVRTAVHDVLGWGEESSDSVSVLDSKLQSLQETAESVIQGTFGNGEDRVKALTDAGWDYAEVQNAVDKILRGETLTTDDLSASIANLTEEELASASATGTGISYLTEWKDLVDTVLNKVNEFILSIDKAKIAEGIGKIINVVKNLGLSIFNTVSSIVNVISTVKQAFHDVFDSDNGSFSILSTFQVIAEKIKEITENFKMSEETVSRLQNIFGGAFAAIDIIYRVAKQLFGTLWDIVKGPLGTAFNFILDIGSGIGIFIKKLDEAVKVSEPIQAIFEKIKSILTPLSNTISEIINDVGSFITKIFSGEKVTSAMDSFANSFKEAGESIPIFETISNIFDKITTALSSIWGFIKNIANSAFGMITKALGDLGNFDFSTISGLIAGISKGSLIGAATSFFANLSQTISGLSSGASFPIISKINGVLTGLKTSLTSLTMEVNIQSLKTIATAVLMLAAACLVLSLIDPERLHSSLASVVILVGTMLGSLWALSKMSTSKQSLNVTAISIALIALAASILLLSLAMAILSHVEPEAMVNGVLSLITILAALTLASKLVDTKGLLTFAISLIPIMAAFAIFSGTLLLYKFMDPASYLTGLITFVAYLIIISGMSHMVDKKGILSLGVAISAITVMFAVFTGTLMLYKFVDPASYMKGLMAFLFMLVSISAISRMVKPARILALSVSLIPAVIALAALGAALQLFKTISVGTLGVTAAALVSFLATMGVAGKLLKPTKLLAISAALIVFSVGLAAIGAVLKIFASLGLQGLIVGLAGVVGILVALAGSVFVIGLIAKACSSSIGPMLKLAAAMTLIGLAAALLGVGILAAALGLTTLATGGAAAINVIIYFIEQLILQIPKFAKSLAEGIGEFFTTLGSMSEGVFKGLTQLILSALESLREVIPELVTTLLDIILELLKGVLDYVPQIVDTAVSIIIAIIDALIPRIPELVQVGARFIAALFEAIVDACDGKADVLIAAFTGILASVTILSKIPITGTLKALANMAIIIGGLTAILVALGALNQIPGLEWIIGEGSSLMSTIGSAIGGFFGSIIGAFGEAVSDAFPAIGQNLSDFMNNASGFIDGVKNISPDMASNIETLVGAVATLAGSNLVSTISGLFGGDTSFSNLGSSLTTFGQAMVDFSNIMVQLDDDHMTALTRGSRAAKNLAELSNAIPSEGGLLQGILGQKDLSSWSTKLPLFGESLVAFAVSVRDLTEEDITSMQVATDAGKQLAELSDAIPNSGGILGFLAGENDIGSWSEQLPTFGRSIVAFANSVSGLTEDSLTSIQVAVDASKKLSEMAAEIPNSGGLLGFFAGENDIGAWGTNLESFGNGIQKFYNSSQGITAEGMETAVSACTEIFKLNDLVPDDTSSLFEKIFGLTDMDVFGTNLQKIGVSLQSFNSYATGLDTEAMNSAISTLQSLSDLDLSDLGAESLESFISGLTGADETIIVAVNGVITTVITAFSSASTENGDFYSAGSDATEAFSTGFSSVTDSVESASGVIVTASINEFSNQIYQFSSVGLNCIIGFIQGMQSMSSAVYSAAYNIGLTALRAAKSAVNSHSPSKKFYELGQNNDQGLINGTMSMQGEVANAYSDVMDTALTTVGKSISTIYDSLSNNLDTESLTIRPVIDTSEIQNGIYGMNSLFKNSEFYAGSVSADIASRIDTSYKDLNAAKMYDDGYVLTAIGSLENKISDLNTAIESMQIVLDSKKIIGGIKSGMNNALGGISVRTNRGVM